MVTENRTWVLGTISYEVVKLEIGEDYFQPVLSIHRQNFPPLAHLLFYLQIINSVTTIILK
jgi:hypothetical protein